MKLIEDMISKSEQMDSDAKGGNKKCFLFDEYALLSQNFVEEEVQLQKEISERLKAKGVNVVRIFDYKVNSQEIRSYGIRKDVVVSEGYVLQERAYGTPLLDRTNWNNENKTYQIDYLKQLESISQEDQQFYNQFFKDWIEIQKEGLQVDPSKPGNFIYEKGMPITFIDLDIQSRRDENIQNLLLEQIVTLLNSTVYNECYPEIKEIAKIFWKKIIEKYKTTITEQGIDVKVFEEVLSKIAPDLKSKQTEEDLELTPELIGNLENTISNNIEKEKIEKEEARRVKVEQEKRKKQKEAEDKRLKEEEDKRRSKKRIDSKMCYALQTLIKEGYIKDDEADIYNTVFQRRFNIYTDLNPILFNRYETVDLGEVTDSMETSVRQYYSQRFKNTGANLEKKILQYKEMRNKWEQKLLTQDECIDYALLECELEEFANGKEIFEVLGIENQEMSRQSDYVADFLRNEKNMSDKALEMESELEDDEGEILPISTDIEQSIIDIAIKTNQKFRDVKKRQLELKSAYKEVGKQQESDEKKSGVEELGEQE